MDHANAHDSHASHGGALTDTSSAGMHPPGNDEHGAHNKHAGHDPDAFRRQFWVVLALTIPVVAWSEEVQHWLGYMAPAFPGSDWIPAILGTIVFVYGGRVFLAGARTEIGERQPGMMTLISLAIVVAFVASWAAAIGIFAVQLWWELATLITVMCACDGRAKARAGSRRDCSARGGQRCRGLERGGSHGALPAGGP